MSISGEQPVYFGPADRPLFGWLDTGGNGPGSGIGVVFCNALGYESISSHRTMRAAALCAAARGCATLRFDYDGTGDSAGDDTDPRRVEAWMAGIDAAIDQLRASSGVRQVCLWGLRFGATLAVLVANRRADVHAIHAVAPVLSGRKYLRELRALAATGKGPRLSSDLQEVAGFLTTPDTLESIAAIDLHHIALPQSTRLMHTYREDLPFDDDWIVGAQRRGCEAAAAPFNGYAAMMLDPHEVVVPQAMIDAGVDWLLGGDAASPTASPTAPTTASASATTLPRTARFAAAGPDLHDAVVETAMQLGQDRGIFAIVSQRADATPNPTPQLLLLLNAGSVTHIGPNRLYVTLARLLASRGMTVARIDLPGLGDSPPHAGAQENMAYSPSALPDIHAAVEALQRLYGPAEVHMTGICSGAYHALKCALDTPAMRSAVPINPLTFFYKQGMSIKVPDAQVTDVAARYGRNALRWESWIKLLRGRVDIAIALQILRRRIVQRVRSTGRNLARHLGMRLTDDLGAELRTIAARQVQLRFIFADSDPGLTMLLEQGGHPVRELQRTPYLKIEVIPDTDHIFANQPGRYALIDAMVRHFDACMGIVVE